MRELEHLQARADQLWPKLLSQHQSLKFQEQESAYLVQIREYLRRFDEEQSLHKQDWILLFEQWTS